MSTYLRPPDVVPGDLIRQQTRLLFLVCPTVLSFSSVPDLFYLPNCLPFSRPLCVFVVRESLRPVFLVRRAYAALPFRRTASILLLVAGTQLILSFSESVQFVRICDRLMFRIWAPYSLSSFAGLLVRPASCLVTSFYPRPQKVSPAGPSFLPGSAPCRGVSRATLAVAAGVWRSWATLGPVLRPIRGIPFFWGRRRWGRGLLAMPTPEKSLCCMFERQGIRDNCLRSVEFKLSPAQLSERSSW